MRQFAGFGTPEETNARYRHLLAAGGTGLSVAFDLPTLMGRDPDHELSLGEVGKCGVSVVSLADMETLFDGIPLGRGHDVDDHQLAGGDDLCDVPGRGRAAGRAVGAAVGHDSERHPEGVHRAEGVHLPAAPVDAADHRHVRVLHARSAALEQHLGERLPHPRGRRDGRAGTGVHAARRHRVRAVRHRRGARRRRVRAADVVLLQRAQRLLRGDREVPRGARPSGPR